MFLVKSPDTIFAWQKSAHHPPLPTCLSVRPFLPAPSHSSRVASVGKGKKTSAWKIWVTLQGCKVRKAKAGACYAEHGASMPGKQVLTQLQLRGPALSWGGGLHPWERGDNSTKARRGAEEIETG